ncbi:MAG: four helix bundle protein [Peptococcaceae bacterium]|nr:four helix bundle protein [Candidatus Syntrophopropionicum ammoniitolerans]
MRGPPLYDDTSRLIVWQKAHDLVLKIYETTQDFPKEELFGLTSQIRRAAVSVASNIVEGKARGTAREFRRFLFMARGSLEETKYQIYLARDLNYIDERKYKKVQKSMNEVGRLLAGLIKSISSRQ